MSASAIGVVGEARRWRVVVPESLEGERLDRAAASLCEGLSRSAARRAIAAGGVRLDGRRVRTASRPVHAGQLLEVGVLAEEPSVRPLCVVYAAHGLVVIEKPPGQHVQATALGERGTVEDAVRRWLVVREQLPAGQRPYVGIVHRLDAPASGLMVVATRRDAARGLGGQFRHRRTERRYLALVEGIPDEPTGRIDLPLTRRVRGRVRIARSGGAPATTFFEVVHTWETPRWSLLSLRLRTGRQHQIRVHLAETVGPIVGDTLYGSAYGRERLRLHACTLGFRQPHDRVWVSFESMPDETFWALPRALAAATGSEGLVVPFDDLTEVGRLPVAGPVTDEPR